ncbi:MAG: FAD-dependent oxidoreductase [Xanthobacteraceae bacterium]
MGGKSPRRRGGVKGVTGRRPEQIRSCPLELSRRVRPDKPCHPSTASEDAVRNLDPDDTEQADLRGGVAPWQAAADPSVPALTQDCRCDVLIVGAGITGALMAEQLTHQGLDVVIIDRERPAHGSTAASTSMLLWEIDRPLRDLAALYGFERATRAYRASLDAMQGLRLLIARLGLPCRMRDKQSLYLAAGESDRDLREEHDLRRQAGLPGDFLDHRALLETFGIARAAALLSPASADADPVLLACAALAVAIQRGARLFDGAAVAFDAAGRSVGVSLESGRVIEARHVVLATGYVMPDIVQATIHKATSSWAIATAPQPENLWPEGVLIWEDRQDYLYARTTADGRIVIGGEDDDKAIEPEARDALTPAKSLALARQLEALWPRARAEAQFKWSGVFDTTSDGLPLIGPVSGTRGVYAAYGYGGNGITFSYLAAQLLGQTIAGTRPVLLDDFAVDRDGVA